MVVGVEPLPPARKRPANECLVCSCAAYLPHAPGLCGLAQVVRNHTRTIESVRIVREKRRLVMARNSRWKHLLKLKPP